MENASKAILIAGSVLIAVIIATALLLMWNNISGYQNSGTDVEKEKQLSDFNSVFSTYDNETVMGTDIISLFNRVNSYDQNIDNDELLDKIQYEHIIIKVNISNIDEQKRKDFKKVLGFNSNEVDIASQGSNTYTQIKEYGDLEKQYGRDVLSKLATYYNSVDQNTDPFGYYTEDPETKKVLDHPIVKQVLEEKRME